MNEHIKRNTPALVEQTLANYGAWDAVSFLLITHNLRQTGYEAWRLGEVACLEDMVSGKPQQMLEVALRHAKSMGLVSTAMAWSGWGKQAGHTLRLFHDDNINTQFQLRLSPKADRPQLDLFMDAPHIVLLNRLRQALLNRSAECDALFDRSLDEMINEPALIRLDAIRSAMTSPRIKNPAKWFTYLNEAIAPAVHDEFAHRSLDIMAPLWRTVADAMASIPFDAGFPDQHASQALLQAHDWEQCIASVEQTPDWFKHASLHDRRIAALIAMHDHDAERTAWMLYCWCCPDTALTALDEADLHACGLHALWQQFAQLENEQSIQCFPALIALKHPSGGDQALIFEHAQHTQGWRDYQQIIALLASEQHGDADIGLRSALKTNNPWLFRAFMATR